MIIIAIQIFQNRLIMQTSSIEPDYSTLHNIIYLQWTAVSTCFWLSLPIKSEPTWVALA